jgi:hypothetical protein
VAGSTEVITPGMELMKDQNIACFNELNSGIKEKQQVRMSINPPL